MLTLYHSHLSAECYAAQLLCALAGITVATEHRDLYPGCAAPGVDPLAGVPMLDTPDGPLDDWIDILARLAKEAGPNAGWWPMAEAEALEQWLTVARALQGSAGLARLHDGMGVAADIDACRGEAHRLLRDIEHHLWFGERAGQMWLIPGARPSVADIALFVHIILCEEGGIDRMDYPAVRRWTDRVRRLDGFVVMSGVFPPAPVPA